MLNIKKIEFVLAKSKENIKTLILVYFICGIMPREVDIHKEVVCMTNTSQVLMHYATHCNVDWIRII